MILFKFLQVHLIMKGVNFIEFLSNIKQTTSQNAYIWYESLVGNQINLLSIFFLLSSSTGPCCDKSLTDMIFYFYTVVAVTAKSNRLCISQLWIS